MNEVDDGKCAAGAAPRPSTAEATAALSIVERLRASAIDAFTPALNSDTSIGRKLNEIRARRGKLHTEAANEIERLRKVNADLIAMLETVSEELDDREDVVDGPDNQPRANWAMSLNREVKETIEAAKATP